MRKIISFTLSAICAASAFAALPQFGEGVYYKISSPAGFCVTVESPKPVIRTEATVNAQIFEVLPVEGEEGVYNLRTSEGKYICHSSVNDWDTGVISSAASDNAKCKITENGDAVNIHWLSKTDEFFWGVDKDEDGAGIWVDKVVGRIIDWTLKATDAPVPPEPEPEYEYGANLLTNGDFEAEGYEQAIPKEYTWEPYNTYYNLSVLPGWNLPAGASDPWNMVVGIFENEGNHYAGLHGYKDGWDPVTLEATVEGLEEGAEYQVDFKKNSPASDDMNVLFKNASGEKIGETGNLQEQTEGWTDCSFTFTANSTTGTLRIWLAAKGNMYLDDFQVRKRTVKEPEPQVDPYADLYIDDSDPRANVYPGYKLIFAQEFSGEGLPDSDVWQYEDGYCRNHEDQYYHQDESNPNAYVKDGVLVIEAREEAIKNKHYSRYGTDWKSKKGQYTKWTSASMQSKGGWNDGFTWLYGIYEVRAKIPAYTGTWPAIWSTGKQYEWPYGGEIDIMEWYGDKIHANVCWGNTQRWGGSWNSKTVSRSALNEKWGEDWGEKFHTWKMVWEEDVMELWVDDILVNQIDLNTTQNQECSDESVDDGNGCNPFRDVRQMIWLNLALGGDNGGSLTNTPFPCRYLIDYVRVYQRPLSDGKATFKVDENISEPTYNVPDGPTDGIGTISGDIANDAQVEWYSLQGMRVNNPVKGSVAIKRQGSSVTKVFVK